MLPLKAIAEAAAFSAFSQLPVHAQLPLHHHVLSTERQLLPPLPAVFSVGTAGALHAPGTQIESNVPVVFRAQHDVEGAHER